MPCSIAIFSVRINFCPCLSVRRSLLYYHDKRQLSKAGVCHLVVLLLPLLCNTFSTTPVWFLHASLYSAVSLSHALESISALCFISDSSISTWPWLTAIAVFVNNMVRPSGWGLLSQFPPFRYFPKFSTSSKHTLTIDYHVYIWQVSPQLSCGGTCLI